MYLTYEEYGEYGGTLDETIFNDLLVQVESIINRRTFNRFLTDTIYPEKLKRLVYHGLNTLYARYNSLGGVGSVSSQSNDGVSISYNNLSASELIKFTDTTFKNSIETYLYGVKNQKGQLVLYRGLYANE